MARRVQAGDGPKLDLKKVIPDPKSFKLIGAGKADYIQHREEVFNQVLKKYQDRLATIAKKDIEVELPNGNKIVGKSFDLTPGAVAEQANLPKKVREATICAKVTYTEKVELTVVCADRDDSDDEDEDEEQDSLLWDLQRPLEGSCKIEFLTFEDADAQQLFWHSSAHVLGEALEMEYGCHLTIGPPLDSGFYYDMYVGEKKIGPDDFKMIEKRAQQICGEKQPFIRSEINKEDALELFKHNPFKVNLIKNKVPDGSITSVYKCGPLIDLCRGPHLPDTGKVKAFGITKNSSAYWLGSADNDSLQRIYAISFPSDKQLKEYLKAQEEAKKRDHRVIGGKQELYFFDDVSAGSCFWQPHGFDIYLKLMEFMRTEYKIRGFEEVQAPNMFHESLFKQSGHAFQYADGMYNLDIEGEKWYLKPMNCPGHCVMFNHRVRSYKELPLRMAEFGVLHRNELSGSLTGLMRVRRFQQDDAHIFCRPDQVKDEVRGALDFMNFVYSKFDMKPTFVLSTKPKKAMGSKEQWDKAEAQLAEALNESGLKWGYNKGDGAFYGPKIDVRIQDALQRRHQCATIQLDFQNPVRFNLQYQKEGEVEGEEGAVVSKEVNNVGQKLPNQHPDDDWTEGRIKANFERPVMIHRAVLGSVERFMGILCEHLGGKWPFFISPRQILVVPVAQVYYDYSKYVYEQLKFHGFSVEVDLSSKTMNKKIREGQMSQFNYVLVLGEKEEADLAVKPRMRTGEELPMMGLAAFIERCQAEGKPSSRVLNKIEAFKGRMPEGAAGAAVAPASPDTLKPTKKAEPATEARKAPAAASKPSKPEDNLEAWLQTNSYVGGSVASDADYEMMGKVLNAGADMGPNVKRWFNHMKAKALM